MHRHRVQLRSQCAPRPGLGSLAIRRLSAGDSSRWSDIELWVRGAGGLAARWCAPIARLRTSDFGGYLAANQLHHYPSRRRRQPVVFTDRESIRPAFAHRRHSEKSEHSTDARWRSDRERQPRAQVWRDVTEWSGMRTDLSAGQRRVGGSAESRATPALGSGERRAPHDHLRCRRQECFVGKLPIGDAVVHGLGREGAGLDQRD